MILKSQIKLIQLLRHQKYRHEHGLFIAEGPKIVNELLASPYLVKSIFALDTFQDLSLLSENQIELIRISHKELERISLLKAPNQVLALVEIPEHRHLSTPGQEGLILALDRISDPGNFGSIIRSADWFGIKEIVCSPDCVDLYNPKVVQASMGSMARVRVHYRNLQDFLVGLENKPMVYGTFPEGENIYQQKLAKNAIVVIGSESQGISENLMPHISRQITVPAFSKGSGNRAESLNASVATALVCSEFRRQHSFSNQ